jgi:hypothetical protein
MRQSKHGRAAFRPTDSSLANRTALAEQHGPSAFNLSYDVFTEVRRTL